MPDGEAASAASNVPSPSTLMDASGEPRYSRRLGDRVLAAFTHAYATGARDIAEQLHAVLRRMDERMPESDCRRGRDLLTQAQMWIVFVDARDHYQAMQKGGDQTETDTAYAAMEEAYRRWAGV